LSAPLDQDVRAAAAADRALAEASCQPALVGALLPASPLSSALGFRPLPLPLPAPWRCCSAAT